MVRQATARRPADHQVLEDPDRPHVAGAALVAEAPGLAGPDDVHRLDLRRRDREPVHRLARGGDRQAADAGDSVADELRPRGQRHDPVLGTGRGHDLDHLTRVVAQRDRVGHDRLSVVRELRYGNGHCTTPSLRTLKGVIVIFIHILPKKSMSF